MTNLLPKPHQRFSAGSALTMPSTGPSHWTMHAPTPGRVRCGAARAAPPPLPSSA